jgi:hypothetical protein
MTYKLSFAQKPGYLHTVVTGGNSKENVARYLTDVQRECMERACRRVLIEERLEGPRLGLLDVFDIAAEGRDRVDGQLPVMAYVDVNAAGTLMKFAEDVAVNRGINVRVFSTVADAEKWLLEFDAAGVQPKNNVTG